MEMSQFTSNLFIPYLIKSEPFDGEDTIALNYQSLFSAQGWITDPEFGVMLKDVCKVQIAFQDYESERIEWSKSDLFTLAISRPGFLSSNKPMGEQENLFMIKGIINCFDGSIVDLPQELSIKEDLLEMPWSYKIIPRTVIYVDSVDGHLLFDVI
jgi:hypothetical protein